MNKKNNSDFFLSKEFCQIHIEPTNACNFNCWMCPREIMTRKVGFMDLDKYKELILELKKFSQMMEMHLGGFGEPTLHPNLFEMISFCKKKSNMGVSLTSNASRFKESGYIDGLLNSGLDDLILSFRHTLEGQMENSLPSAFKYEEFQQSVLQLIKRKIELKSPMKIDIAFLKGTVYSRSILGIDDDEYLDSKRIDVFTRKLSAITGKRIPTFKELTRGILPKISKLDHVNVADGVTIRLDSLGPWTTSVTKYKNKCYRSSYGSCLGLKSHFVVYQNGIVSTCCADFDAKNNLGNFFEEKDLTKILSRITARGSSLTFPR